MQSADSLQMINNFERSAKKYSDIECTNDVISMFRTGVRPSFLTFFYECDLAVQFPAEHERKQNMSNYSFLRDLGKTVYLSPMSEPLTIFTVWPKDDELIDEQEGGGPADGEDDRPIEEQEGGSPTDGEDDRPIEEQEGGGPTDGEDDRPIEEQEGGGPTDGEDDRPIEEQEGGSPTDGEDDRPIEEQEGGSPTDGEDDRPIEEQEGGGPTDGEDDRPIQELGDGIA